jgi:hypothetical protein
MMKIGRGLLALLLVAAAMAALSLPVARSSSTDGIELLYFHRTDRCQSCNNAEQYARDTLNTYFPDQLKSGTLSIQSIDYQKDRAMAEKYGVNMQGLKLKITKNGQETVKDVSEIWAYVRDKNAYMSYLQDVLKKELGR